jgi:catechol 2,3-dioxygenase-like lactoylglutathione lyase family enzyme
MALPSFLCLSSLEEKDMEIVKTGMRLSTSRWTETVHFYRDILGFPVRQDGERWIVFDFDNGYLLLEQSGEALERCQEQWRTALRFDVKALDTLIHQLEEQCVVFKKSADFDWEDLVILLDPAGNQIEFKQG